jgi:adenosylcobinamide-phosphate synthase
MSAHLSLQATALLAWAGVVLDRLLGEPRRAHPLVAFGRAAQALERRFNPDRDATSARGYAAPSTRLQRMRARSAGVAAWLIAVAPPVALSVALTRNVPQPAAWALHAGLLWFALGARSLADHVAPIERALRAGQLDAARNLAARIVSRGLSQAGEVAVARAAVESTLENGNDAIFGALFWFALAGGPGALAFRLVNTLDAMWGYRTPRLRWFGWAAARLDDVANYVPARLTALGYALCGDARAALRCWRTQARAWDSPNAGPVMASGAGSLHVLCGGAARYHGVDEARPVLGTGRPPRASDVGGALRLVRRTLLLWLGALTALSWLSTLLPV